MTDVQGTFCNWSARFHYLLYFSLCAISIFLVGCGVLNLESQECSDARIPLRAFYSFHFDLGVTGDPVEDLKVRQRFLTPEFGKRLADVHEPMNDPFTLSDSLPNTFKLGECSSSGANAVFRVQVYWRDDHSTVQKDFYTAMKNADSGWLMDDISATPPSQQE